MTPFICYATMFTVEKGQSEAYFRTAFGQSFQLFSLGQRSAFCEEMKSGFEKTFLLTNNNKAITCHVQVATVLISFNGKHFYGCVVKFIRRMFGVPTPKEKPATHLNKSPKQQQKKKRKEKKEKAK